MIRKRQCISAVRNLLFTLAAAGSAAFAFLAREPSAFAQARFGDKGQLAITGENLFSLQTERWAASPPPTGLEISTTQNRFGFLYSQGTPSPHGPQAGVHYFIIPSLSLGGTIGYEARGGSVTTRQGPAGVQVTTDTEDTSTFNLQFKVGYALMFNDIVGFWFRGGPGFFRIGTQEPGPPVKDSNSYWLLSLDALLVVSPFRNFAFYVGPQGDISFAGTHSHTAANGVTTSYGTTYRDIGIGLGLIGYVDL